MAKMPLGEPRSVPDPDGELYDEMLKTERLKLQQDQAGAKPTGSVGHPGFAESLIPVWGCGREAVADFQEGDYAGAALNSALATSDLFLAGSLAKGVAKGSFYVARGAARAAPEAYSWKKRHTVGRKWFDPGWESKAILRRASTVITGQSHRMAGERTSLTGSRTSRGISSRCGTA